MTTEKHLQSGEGKNAQGITTPYQAEDVLKKWEPGETVVGEFPLDNFYKFKLQELQFLREYAKDLDDVRAAAAVGVSVDTVRRWFHKEGFQNEITSIHEVWRKNIRMTAEHAGARHIQLMDKIESEFDKADNSKDKAMLANPLAKMSDSYLKATKAGSGFGGSDAQVVINIDLGSNDKGVTIDGNSGRKI